ncbi:PadR family transcriptional regulator [Nonomuraea polychroma]|uniref:PadR family transcriptional regulator n=1 Tax=Nonomuraea polychroma TaxID=46176 RepID=A0A438M4H4_9ACTN|nr:helix-turn-helix transcriptional regulator [Nonomuraea polychroma]RVX40756.1 PadR family transcriptional regulator [Nonomuraea polychroma]
MGKTPRMTIPTQLVLRALLEDPTREMYGLEICQAAGLAPGTIHPILARFEGIGWLESRFEDVDPHKAGRPRRRYYWLTSEGAEQARNALAQTRTKAFGLGVGPRPVEGTA